MGPVPIKAIQVSMGGRAEGLACAELGARTPIGGSGINPLNCQNNSQIILPEGLVMWHNCKRARHQWFHSVIVI